jgi:hypothetical protein
LKSRWLVTLQAEIALEKKIARRELVRASQKHYNSPWARRHRRLRYLKRKRGF